MSLNEKEQTALASKVGSRYIKEPTSLSVIINETVSELPKDKQSDAIQFLSKRFAKMLPTSFD